MANFESVKVAGEAVLDGVQVELEKRDGTVVGVTFTDVVARASSGRSLEAYYGATVP